MHKKKCKNKLLEINKIEQLETKINELESKLNTSIISTTNTINGNNNTTNNGTINNIIVDFGKEDLNALTTKEKKQILNKGSLFSMLKLVETMHFNKNHPQFQNIQITNLKDDYAKIYDSNINDFKTVKCQDTITQLINNKSENLGDLLEELEDQKNPYHKAIHKFIEIINSYSPKMEDKQTLDFYNDMRKDIIILIYNKTREYKNNKL
jgi:hypothetical protein